MKRSDRQAVSGRLGKSTTKSDPTSKRGLGSTPADSGTRARLSNATSVSIRTTAPPVNEVLLGDCIEGMSRLDSECIDLVFADPPFNIGYDYDTYDDRQEDATYQDWSRQWIAQVYRLLRPGGAFWLAIGDEYAAELKIIAHRELGFSLRNWCIWYYTFGVHCRQKFARSHTHLFYFVKPGAPLTFHGDAVRIPSARQLIYRDKRANPSGRIPDNTWILRPQEFDLCGEGTTDDCWHIPRVCGTFHEREGWHGCQMPEKVLERIILSCSDEDSFVLDPFAGSGTTLVVAKRFARRYLGFELSPEYLKRCRERIEG